MFRKSDSATMLTMVVKVVWTVTVAGALVLLAQGLWAGFYFEGTDDALAEARRGRLMVIGACLLLIGAAGFAVFAARWPVWLGIVVVVPVLLVVLGRVAIALLTPG